MNDLIDTLNSNSLFNKNPLMCALSENNVLEFLTYAKEWNLNLIKISNKGNTRPPCFDGMVLTINAILQLYEDQKKYNFEYLLTARLNQDFLENTFSIYRQRGGYNKNPTARTFRTTFRINSKINLMKPSDNSNCKSDNDINILSQLNTPINETINSVELDNSYDSNSSSSSLTSSLSTSTNLFDENVCDFSLEECSNTYFAGYLGYKYLNKINCNICKNIFLKENQYFENKNELLIQFKTFENKDIMPTKLKLPTSLLVNFVKSAQQIYKKTIEKNPQKKKLCLNILKEIEIKLYPLMKIENSCQNHLDYITTHLIHCRLLRDFNFISKNQKSKKNIDKLCILQNV